MCSDLGAEKGAAFYLSLLDVIPDTDCGGRIDANRSTLVAFLVDADFRVRFVPLKILNIKTTSGCDAAATEEIKINNCSVAVVE